jgi:hypothetical protein
VGAYSLLFGLLCLAQHRVDGLAGCAGLHSHCGLARARMALGARAKVPDCRRHGGGAWASVEDGHFLLELLTRELLHTAPSSQSRGLVGFPSF